MGNYIVTQYKTNGKRTVKHYADLHSADVEFNRVYVGQSVREPHERNVRYVVLRRRDDGAKLRWAKLAGKET